MRKFFKYFTFLFTIILIAGCSDVDNPQPDEDSQNIVNHVVFIGLDGWGGYGFDISRLPTISSLLDLGVWSLNKQAVLPSGSGQNWTSMFMGVPPAIHGYSNWDSTAPSISYDFEIKNKIFPTIFQVVRDQLPDSEIGVFYQWESIKYFVDTLSVDIFECVPLDLGHEIITNSFTDYILKKKPTLCAIVYDDPDHTGHQHGYFTEGYYDILIKLDACISKIIQTTKEAGIFDKSVFIITSDHGGIGYSHSGDTPDELDTPFIMFGNGIKKLGRVDNTLVQYDIAPIIAGVLGLKTPNVWIGNKHIEFKE